MADAQSDPGALHGMVLAMRGVTLWLLLPGFSPPSQHPHTLDAHARHAPALTKDTCEVCRKGFSTSQSDPALARAFHLKA